MLFKCKPFITPIPACKIFVDKLHAPHVPFSAWYQALSKLLWIHFAHMATNQAGLQHCVSNPILKLALVQKTTDAMNSQLADLIFL